MLGSAPTSAATLIDSSAWIELFRATGSATHVRLRELLESDAELATTEPVAMELLAGVSSVGQGRQVRGALAACRMHPVSGPSDWESAAAVYRSCRVRGTTPRSLMDCLLASVAIRAGLPILAADRDFDAIAQHTALELA